MEKVFPQRLRRIAGVLSCLVLIPCLGIRTATASNSPDTDTWRADHHVHLSSPKLCRVVGDAADGGCLETNHPPAVLAADALKALDEAHVSKGVVLSCAYLFALRSLHLSASEIATAVRSENEFTAAQVSKYPKRLVAFLSVDPLQDSAVQEIDYWSKRSQFAGVKLHFTASAVNLRSAEDRRKVRRVLAEAAKQHFPLVIHLGGGEFNGADAELFITDVLPNAGDSWVQIAHAGGGLPRIDANNVSVLRTFADHISRNDPRTRKVLFDLSFVPGPDDSSADAAAYARGVRRIGLSRFLFGSDFNVQMPAEAIQNLQRLKLTPEEMQTLRTNCAPWAC